MAQYIEDINLKGFIVVEHQFFEKEKIPSMSLFRRKVTFNKESHILLDKCQAIQMMVNFESRQIIARPMSSADEDSIIWHNEKLKDPFVSDIGCPLMTTRIYKEWKLNPNYRYKTRGRLVKSEKKLMLLFDFNEADAYEGIKLVGKHG